MEGGFSAGDTVWRVPLSCPRRRQSRQAKLDKRFQVDKVVMRAEVSQNSKMGSRAVFELAGPGACTHSVKGERDFTCKRRHGSASLAHHHWPEIPPRAWRSFTRRGRRPRQGAATRRGKAEGCKPSSPHFGSCSPRFPPKERAIGTRVRSSPAVTASFPCAPLPPG